MKRIFKQLLIFTLCLTCLFSFASCSGGIKGDEAKAFIRDFFDAIVAEDYAQAETFLHPERPGDLEAFFLNIEEEETIDFQAGITVERYTGISAAYYDSSVAGSTYELTMRTKVGEKTVKFTIEIVKNENGYGIYNLDVDT